MFRDDPMTSKEIWRMILSLHATGVPVPAVNTEASGGVSIAYRHQHDHKQKWCLRIHGAIWRCGLGILTRG